MKISDYFITKYLENKFNEKEIIDAFSLYAFEVDDVDEVEGQKVYDIDVLPNRSSDCLSCLGLARELSVILKQDMEDPFKLPTPAFKETNLIELDVRKESSANIYLASYIKNVKVEESPEWLKKILITLGQKPINNIVDITNLVLFEYGAPMHAFDADKLAKIDDKIKMGVRLAKDKERFVSLDDKEYELTDKISVIHNKNNEEVLAVAGVKGGKTSGVDADTKNIILEAAHFDPTDTRRASNALKLRTDASKRFENELPGLLPYYAMNYAIELINQIAGGEFEGLAKYDEYNSKNPEISLDLSRAEKVLGTNLKKDEVVEILKRQDFDVNDLSVRAPWWRTDIQIEEDVIEEIARLKGMYKLESKPISTEYLGNKILPAYYWSEKLRKFFIDNGFVEITNSTLQDRGELKLKNALASDKNHFRDNLQYSMLKSLDKNEKNTPLLGIYDFLKLFEIGTVYKDGKEYISVCAGIRSLQKKKKEEKAHQLLTELKDKLESEFGIKIEEPANEILEFPLTVFDEKEICQDYPDLPILSDVQYTPFSQFPFVLRDIAVWIPENENESKLIEVIHSEGGELLVRCDKFDEFKKDGKVSYAYHLVFQSKTKTLTDIEVNEIMEKIETQIAHNNWEVR